MKRNIPNWECSIPQEILHVEYCSIELRNNTLFFLSSIDFPSVTNIILFMLQAPMPVRTTSYHRAYDCQLSVETKTRTAFILKYCCRLPVVMINLLKNCQYWNHAWAVLFDSVPTKNGSAWVTVRSFKLYDWQCSLSRQLTALGPLQFCDDCQCSADSWETVLLALPVDCFRYNPVPATTGVL